MSICLRLTSLTTLLIGLQLLSPKILFSTQSADYLLNNNSSNHAVITFEHNTSREFNLIGQTTTEDFIPQNNGHPNNTRGSGTR